MWEATYFLLWFVTSFHSFTLVFGCDSDDKDQVVEHVNGCGHQPAMLPEDNQLNDWYYKVMFEVIPSGLFQGHMDGPSLLDDNKPTLFPGYADDKLNEMTGHRLPRDVASYRQWSHTWFAFRQWKAEKKTHGWVYLHTQVPQVVQCSGERSSFTILCSRIGLVYVQRGDPRQRSPVCLSMRAQTGRCTSRHWTESSRTTQTFERKSPTIWPRTENPFVAWLVIGDMSFWKQAWSSQVFDQMNLWHQSVPSTALQNVSFFQRAGYFQWGTPAESDKQIVIPVALEFIECHEKNQTRLRSHLTSWNAWGFPSLHQPYSWAQLAFPNQLTTRGTTL